MRVASLLVLLTGSFLAAFPAFGQISVNTWVQGCIRIGWYIDPTCNSSAEGGLRYDSVDKEFEFCNGTSWLPVLMALSQPYLVMTPTTATMDITGPGTPDYSSYTTFTVENLGTIDSGTITFTLTDTTYFEFGTNTCTGGASGLSQSETCTIQVRAKAAIDTNYSGQLRVNVNNEPTANLSGTSTASCGAAGDNYGGGKLVKCEAGYALVATPGGCTDSATPTCGGTVDTVLKTFSSGTTNYRGAGSTTNGAAHTTLLVSYHANPPTYNAAKYCDDMTYGGYSDWYLPLGQNASQMQSLAIASAAIGGFPSLAGC